MVGIKKDFKLVLTKGDSLDVYFDSLKINDENYTRSDESVA